VAKALWTGSGESTGVRVGGGFSNATGLGDQFISAKGYQAVRDAASRSQVWTSGPVELQSKATLTSTPGTALTPAGYRPGIVETLSQTNYVADLMPNEQAPGNPVRFVQETTATNAAAAVAETGQKPESTFVFSEVSEPVRKLATFLPVSDELFEDAPQIGAYLNQRLALFVRNVEEAQILLGSGTAPNLQGFVATGRTIGTYVRSAGTTNERAILNAATGSRGSSFLEPDTVVIHPNNYLAIRAGTDTTGNYLAGGPLLASYGGPQGPAGAFGGERLWGMRVVVSSNITVGTALVGAFREGAAVFRKGALTVEATNSHGTYFQSNITALRAEERLALAVYRPSAFVAVTNLS